MDIRIWILDGPTRNHCIVSRGGIGRGGSDGLGQFDLLEETGSGQIRSIYILYFFRFLININWIADCLISNRIRFKSELIRWISRVGSSYATSCKGEHIRCEPTDQINKNILRLTLEFRPIFVKHNYILVK
jgi:hypothetical protein